MCAAHSQTFKLFMLAYEWEIVSHGFYRVNPEHSSSFVIRYEYERTLHHYICTICNQAMFHWWLSILDTSPSKNHFVR